MFGSAREYRACQPAIVQTEEDLRAFLDERAVGFLVVRANRNPGTRPDFMLASRLAADSEGRWELIYDGRTYALYRARHATGERND
jgi:hypothetical protein